MNSAFEEKYLLSMKLTIDQLASMTQISRYREVRDLGIVNDLWVQYLFTVRNASMSTSKYDCYVKLLGC